MKVDLIRTGAGVVQVRGQFDFCGFCSRLSEGTHEGLAEPWMWGTLALRPGWGWGLGHRTHAPPHEGHQSGPGTAGSLAQGGPFL